MTQKLFLVSLALFSMVSHAATLFAGAAPETAGQILARLSKLAPEQRQATLIEKARLKAKLISTARCKPNRSSRSCRSSASAIRS